MIQFCLYSIFKKVIYNHHLKKIIKKQFGFIYHKKNIYLFCYKKDEFLHSYLRKYFNLSSFKESGLYELFFKKLKEFFITLFAKEILKGLL